MSERDKYFEQVLSLKKDLSERLGWLNNTLCELQNLGVKVNCVSKEAAVKNDLLEVVDITLSIKI